MPNGAPAAEALAGAGQGDDCMQVTRSSIETQKGPADWFTGDVYIDEIAAPAGTSTFAFSQESVSSVERRMEP